MQSYTPGKPASISFSLATDSGEVLVPTGLRFRVLDEHEVVLQNWTTTPVPDEAGAESVTVTVIGPLNILTPPATRGARVVELEIVDGSGTTIRSESYLLQGTTALTFGVNTFLLYTAAIVQAADFVPMQVAGWTGADRALRERALIEAYGRIQRLPVQLLRDNDQNIDGEYQALFGPVRLSDLTPIQIAGLEPRLLLALKQAQLVEADEILSDDPIKKARAEGVVSMTVGESSQFFGTSRPLDLGASKRAMKYLERWLRFGAAIGRR